MIKKNPLFWKPRLSVSEKCSVDDKITGGSQE